MKSTAQESLQTAGCRSEVRTLTVETEEVDQTCRYEAPCVSGLPPAGRSPHAQPHLPLHRLLVALPFLMCTLLLGLIHRDRGEVTSCITLATIVGRGGEEELQEGV